MWGSTISGWSGWLGFLCPNVSSNCFQLIWLINFVNQPQTRLLEQLKKHLHDNVTCL